VGRESLARVQYHVARDTAPCAAVLNRFLKIRSLRATGVCAANAASFGRALSTYVAARSTSDVADSVGRAHAVHAVRSAARALPYVYCPRLARSAPGIAQCARRTSRYA
jgi:hypothetical protein